MTKKHFIAIAEILAWNSADATMIANFCNYFKTQNPNFDAGRFIAYIEDVKEEITVNE